MIDRNKDRAGVAVGQRKIHHVRTAGDTVHQHQHSTVNASQTLPSFSIFCWLLVFILLQIWGKEFRRQCVLRHIMTIYSISAFMVDRCLSCHVKPTTLPVIHYITVLVNSHRNMVSVLFYSMIGAISKVLDLRRHLKYFSSSAYDIIRYGPVTKLLCSFE